MLDQTELERRLNRLPTKRWWLGFIVMTTMASLALIAAMVVFSDNIKAVLG